MAEKLTGWKRPEAFGRTIDEVFRTVNESDRSPAQDPVGRVLFEGTIVSPIGATLLISRDGREFPIEHTAAPIQDDRNVTTGVVLVFRDVGARKRAERDLAESEARFRAFMDHSPIIAFLKDEEGRYLWGNRAWARQHKGRTADPIGRTDFELWPEETARQFRAGDRSALEAQAAIERVEKAERPNGEEVRMMTLKFPLEDGSGRRHVGGIALDITSRLKAEEALRESERRYRLLFDANPHSMWVYDVESLGFLAVNEAAIERYGYSREEFLAMTIADIRPAEDIEALHRAVRERRGRTFANTTGWRHLKKDGTIIDVEITSTSVEFDGRAARIVLANDVTQRLEAERALRVSRERLDLVLGAARLGVWFSDLPFDRLEWNDRCKEHFGVQPGDPVNLETFRARLHPEDRDRLRHQIDEAIEGKAAVNFEFRTLDPTGRVRWVHAIGRVFRDQDDRPSRFDAVTVDVTDAKRAEADLREARD